jgi:hypothetical protein
MVDGHANGARVTPHWLSDVQLGMLKVKRFLRGGCRHDIGSIPDH